MRRWRPGHARTTRPTHAPRPEWSKGWGYTSAGPWTDATALSTTIPDDYREARRVDEDWDWALGTLNDLDPHRIFSNPFLDSFLP